MRPLIPAGRRAGFLRMEMSKKPVRFQTAAAGIWPPAQPHDYALAERKPHNGTRRASTLALARLVARKAKPGGAVNGGAQAPFILTVDGPARFCYLANGHLLLCYHHVAYAP